MSDIPDAVIEAAARGVYAEIQRRVNPFGKTWGELTEEERRESNTIARAALLAAMPHLVAAERRAIQEFHWMARRYCDGRMSTAPNSFNSITKELLLYGVELRAPHFARDGMGRAYDDLTDDEALAAQEDMPRGAVLEAEWRLRAAELIAAEREACARVADGMAQSGPNPQIHGKDWLLGRQSGAQETAAAIRARGDAIRG